MLISDLPSFSDAYIVVKGRIIAESNALSNRANKKLVFKNNALLHGNQKSITYSLTMQKIFILLSQSIIS